MKLTAIIGLSILSLAATALAVNELAIDRQEKPDSKADEITVKLRPAGGFVARFDNDFIHAHPILSP